MTTTYAHVCLNACSEENVEVLTDDPHVIYCIACDGPMWPLGERTDDEAIGWLR